MNYTEFDNTGLGLTAFKKKKCFLHSSEALVISIRFRPGRVLCSFLRMKFKEEERGIK